MAVGQSCRAPAACARCTRPLAAGGVSCRADRWRGGSKSRQSRLHTCRIQAAAATLESTDVDVGKMEPLGDRVLVKPLEEKKTTESGLVLTSSTATTMQDALIGEVLGVGVDVDVGVKKGDTVIFSKYSSTDVNLPQGEVCFVAQKSILATLS